MIQIGDLVKIDHRYRRCNDLGKLAIVEHVGTWSCDIHIIESGRKPRYAKTHLIKLVGAT